MSEPAPIAAPIASGVAPAPVASPAVPAPPPIVGASLVTPLTDVAQTQLRDPGQRRLLLKILCDFGLISKEMRASLQDTTGSLDPESFLVEVRRGIALAGTLPSPPDAEDAFADKLADWLGAQTGGARISSNTWAEHPELCAVANLLRQRAWRKPSSKPRSQ